MPNSSTSLRLEIAAAAARLIADSGLDYASAKRKGAQEVCGTRPPRGALPDNDQIDEALREHLDLFDEHHAERVRALRETALELMDELAAFSPLVTGAAWKGIAAEHAPLHLQLFPDNAKEVEYWLLNRRIEFDVDTIGHFRGRDEVPVLALVWKDTGVLLSLYDADDQRGALHEGSGRGSLRGTRDALAARMKEES
ncbi:MAG TPA: hypothetical protein PK359_04840 [Burkholderiaceae bacterium]|nr:hypothetical protein [Burkholderiaceae bacterium]